MPIPTPFHPRTSTHCTSLFWKDWAGYHAVRTYDTTVDREYFALRHAAGMIDVSPLYKMDVEGPDAGRFLARIMVKDVRKLAVGQVTYLCWCDDEGKVVDDGTVTRMGEDAYRVTAAEPTWGWLMRHRAGAKVTITEITDQIGALAVQGPTSRDVLKACSDADLDGLKFFRMTHCRIGGHPAIISRTGYTGDLGYEVWVDREHAVSVWDAIFQAGQPYRVLPVGLDAMDMTRVEAGFIMNGVDYFSAHHCLVESRKSTPFELGLGWTVKLDREPFMGQEALRREKAEGSKWAFVGLVLDWDKYESLFARFGLPPQTPAGAWRTPVPVYGSGGVQVGFATSGSFSPTLKKNLALAHVRTPHHELGRELQIEVTAEFERHRVPAVVTQTPFFNPARKRA